MSVVLTSLSPDPSTTAGGATITVLCTNAADVTGVTVDGVARTVTPIDATHFSFVSQAHVAGSVDVIAQTSGADSNTITMAFQAPVVLASLATSPATTEGGATIIVTCTNAANVTGVTADGVARTVTPIDGTHFSFVTAPHVAGTVNVIAQTAIGNSNTITMAFQAPVVLTSLTPDSVSSVAKDTVIVHCTNAANVTACTVDGASRTTTVLDATRFSFVMPAKAAGSYAVIAQTAIGNSNTLTISVALDNSAPNESIYGILATEPIAAKTFPATPSGAPAGALLEMRGLWVRAPGTLAVTYKNGMTDTFTAADFSAGQIIPMIGVAAITGTPTLTGKIIY